MIIVSDSSPLINLACINKLHLLPELFNEVIIPHSVYQEIVEFGEGQPGSDAVKNSSWISVRNCNRLDQLNEFRKELDMGEAEALTLAIELNADILLIDEFKGRAIARKNKIHVLGLLGILLEAKKRNLINNIKLEMDRLIADANFWISSELYSEILIAADEQGI